MIFPVLDAIAAASDVTIMWSTLCILALKGLKTSLKLQDILSINHE